jgi:exopolysaccharide production protein ExoY
MGLRAQHLMDMNASATTAETYGDKVRRAGVSQDRTPASRSALVVGGVTKRVSDIALASIAAIALLPLLLGIALLLKVTSRGPVLYGHERVGLGGRRFRCMKFRTMVVDGDRVLEEHFRQFPAERDVWLAERKLRDDPRVTPLGAILRKLSIDELPQLYNIILGQMSIVGPRPVVADELKIYGGSAAHYLRTRPGLTGLWQISGRNDTSYQRRVLLDRLYVLRWSLMLDLRIVVLTIPAVLTSRGAR